MMKHIPILFIIGFFLSTTHSFALPKIAIFFTERGAFSEENIENIKKVMNATLSELGARYELVPIEEVAFRFDDEYEFPESQFQQKRFIIRIFARLRLDSLIVAKLVTVGDKIISKLKFIHKSEIEKLDFDKAEEYAEFATEETVSQKSFFLPIFQKILGKKDTQGVHIASIDRSREVMPKPKEINTPPKETIFGKNLIALYSGQIEAKEFKKAPERTVTIASASSLDELFRKNTRTETVQTENKEKENSTWKKSYWPITIVGSVVAGSISAYAAYYYMNNDEHYETVTIRGVP